MHVEHLVVIGNVEAVVVAINQLQAFLHVGESHSAVFFVFFVYLNVSST